MTRPAMSNYVPFKERLLGAKKNEIKCVWWLNIGVEQAWSAAEGSIIPRLSGRESDSVVSKSEQMCLMIADHNDIVILRDKLPLIVTESLKAAGLDLPETWVLPEHEADAHATVSELILKNRNMIGRLRNLNQKSGNILLSPYAMTSLEREIAEATDCRIIGTLPETVVWVNSKINARLLAMEAGLPVTDGFICASAEEVLSGIKRFMDSGAESIVMKDAYGASGKGLYIIDSEKSMAFLNQMLLRRKSNGKQIRVIVEKWYDTKADINYQIFIKDEGEIAYIPPKKQILTGVIYRGSEFPVDHFLNSAELEFYKASAKLIGKKLFERGYRGIASIDSIITKDNVIFPVVEINGRFSLSTYISFVPARLKRAKFFVSRYYNIYTDAITADVLEKLGQNNYTPEKGEGIIVYSYVEKTGALPGRIFILYAYNDLHRLYEKEKWVNKMFNSAIA